MRYDYKGRDFERLDQVRELAELIALDIQCTESEDLDLVEVQVRNVGRAKNDEHPRRRFVGRLKLWSVKLYSSYRSSGTDQRCDLRLCRFRCTADGRVLVERLIV